MNLNIWVFKWRLKVRMFSHSRMSAGRECITDITWTVSKQAEGSTFSLGLRDMTRRVRDCLVLRLLELRLTNFSTYLHTYYINGLTYCYSFFTAR